MTPDASLRSRFGDLGYLGPVRVLSAEECRCFLEALGERCDPPPDWDKGHAAVSRVFYDIGTHPAIIDVVTTLLGADVMLWGAGLVRRSPGQVHPWHSDIESSAPSARAVSVWLGLEHNGPESSLRVIAGSHRLGITVQQVRQLCGRSREETTDDDVVRWARERDERTHLGQPVVTDGEAIFFDGRIWHGSHNGGSHPRRGLLLQYATPDLPVRIPDLDRLDWPFRQLDEPRPACLMVRGTDTAQVNRFVPAPSACADGARLPSAVYPLRIPVPLENQGLIPLSSENEGWRPYGIFKGHTANLRQLSCHVSVLAHRQCPHPPHAHDEEEILLLLAGDVDLIFPDEQAPEGLKRMRLTAGQFVYYPRQFFHTLETASETPANYLMFKWHTDPIGSEAPLPFGRFEMVDTDACEPVPDGFRPRVVFEGPTSQLRKLQCHTSSLSPGAGYEPHVDAYDVAIVVLEGHVETLGERVEPHGVIFYPAGEPHGMRNPGRSVARYLVFEFHGSQSARHDAPARGRPTVLARLGARQRWKRAVQRLAARFRRGA